LSRKLFTFPYIVWIALFTIIPLLLIAYYAFIHVTPGKELVFTFDNLAKAFQAQNLNVLVRSIWLAAVATVICLILGYPTAMLLSRLPSSNARTIAMLFVLPMWMNFLLRTYAWKALLDDAGLINQLFIAIGIGKIKMLNTEGALVFGLVYTFLPFMILPIYSVFLKMNRSYIEAAEDLGANKLIVFSRVVLPLSLPGIISGITMVFMPAVTTFVVSQLLGGGKVMMYGELIQRQFMEQKDWGFGSALAVVMMVLMILSMAIMRKYDKGSEGGALF
jgi:spermidine/putrescine transport system permease protein